jgi:precorrin-6B C5,15-methyltransferase / cobalt-precorrin-6B C5,C15-methyltransferase
LTRRWLSIIGINEDGLQGLSAVALSLINQAEIVFGGDRHLKMLPEKVLTEKLDASAQIKLAWQTPIENSIQQILSYGDRPNCPSVCVLASGNPMWYGIGVTLTQRLPLDQINILPSPSTFSLICAKLGWAIAEVETLSLCGRPVGLLQSYLYPQAKILILSANRHTPHQVIDLLNQHGFGGSAIAVLEHLGGSQERIVRGEAQTWHSPQFKIEFADLNAIAIECIAQPDTKILSRIPGLPDHAYIHDGQLTKKEVRAITLSALAPMPGELLWDVGAGCGSIGIEWMRSHPRCRAIAIEKARTAFIANNAICLGTPNLQIINGIAPAALEDLPAPDAIFIGGGVTNSGVFAACWQALPARGRLVVNAVTLESEQQLWQWQQQFGGSLTKITIQRVEAIGAFRAWKPMKDITQWQVVKNGQQPN